MLADSNLEFKTSFNLEDCYKDQVRGQTESVYYCDTNTREEGCLFFDLECSYSLHSYSVKPAVLYLDRYLILTTPRNGSWMANATVLAGNAILMITVKTDTVIEIGKDKYALKGIQQILPTVVQQLFLNRDDIDKLGVFQKLGAYPEQMHRYANTILASISGILSLVLGIVGIIKLKSLRPNRLSTRTATNAKKNNEDEETEAMLRASLNLRPKRRTERTERAEEYFVEFVIY